VLSFLKRKDSTAPAGAVDEAASVQAARTRARRRLIGAAVLVGVGIVGFPLLFETQPRPIAVDIPIEIPARDNVPPLKLPPAKGAAGTTPRAASPVLAESVAEPPAEAPPPATHAQAPAAASAALSASQTPRAERVASAQAVAPAPAERTAASAPDKKAEAQRVQALLEGKTATAVAPPAAAASEPKAGRFVVQAGAYTDAATLREARQKVEKLGLKTYTQVVETESGARTRVRVGPFDSREEAEKAASRIKSAGLAANILTL
jgi:DedD protein